MLQAARTAGHTEEQLVLIELCRQQHHKLSVVMLATSYIRLPFDKGELHTAELVRTQLIKQSLSLLCDL